MLPSEGDILGDFYVHAVAYNGNSKRVDPHNMWSNWSCTLLPREAETETEDKKATVTTAEAVTADTAVTSAATAATAPETHPVASSVKVVSPDVIPKHTTISFTNTYHHIFYHHIPHIYFQHIPPYRSPTHNHID